MAEIPGVQITEHGGGARKIDAAPTSVALLVGWSPSGATDKALRVQSFADYRRDFGLDPRSLLGYAVGHFFDNGGADAHVLRIAGRDGAAIEPDEEEFLSALHAALSPGGPVDQADPFNLICVPGLSDAASIAMLQARASARGAFLIADGGKTDTVASVIAALAGKTGPDARNSALYFPWVLAPDSLDGNAVRAFPPSGFAAGVFSRLDRERGVWKAPAGEGANLIGASDLAVHVDDAGNEQLIVHGVNGLRRFTDRSPLIFGARTLAGDDSGGSEWKYIPVRRLALFLEQSLQAGLQWVVFEPNGEPLWAQVRTDISTFLLTLFRQGAFLGSRASEAYFVRCDRTTMTQADIDRGILNIVIGFAAQKPSEFVILTLSQLTASSSSG